MRKGLTSQSGSFNRCILASFTLCSVGVLLAMLSFAAPAGPPPPPGGGLFTPVGSMSSPRSSYAAALLPSGKVLFTGGEVKFVGISTDGHLVFEYTNRAELFDPAT